jgi:hypothetical protein
MIGMDELAVEERIPIEAGDFITNIGYDRGSGALVLVHERNQIQVAMEGLVQEGQRLKLESNIYDALLVGQTLMTSNKNMPVLPTPFRSDSSTSTRASPLSPEPPSTTGNSTPRHS